MALFGRPEYQIGRGEVAESRVEAPYFIALMLVAAVSMVAVHAVFHDLALTIALAVSMLVFGVTIMRVDFGVAFLLIAMLGSPEISAGPVGLGRRQLNLRYEDILILIVFAGVLVRQAWEGRRLLWRPSPVNIPITLYFGLAVFASIRAVRLSLPYWDKEAAFFVVLKMAEFYMIFFLVGNAIRTRRQVRALLILFFTVAIYVALYAIFSVGVMDRVSAPFETGGTEPNTLGGYLMIVICVAASLLIYAPTRKLRGLFFLLAVIAFAPLLYTLSRASYIALLAALFALGALGKKPMIIIGTIGILLVSPFILPTEVLERVNYTFQRGSGVEVQVGDYETGLQVDTSTYERIYVWGKVRHNLRIWPWFGGGVAWSNVLDSHYARVIIESGLFGLAAFLFMQYKILKTTSQARRWSGDWLGKALGLAAQTATLGLMVHAMGTISFLIVRIMEPYWFLVALAVVMRSLALEEYFQQKDAEAREAQLKREEEVAAAQDSPVLV